MKKFDIMKLAMAFCLALAVNITLATSEWISIGNASKHQSEIRMISGNHGETTLQFTVNAYRLNTVQTPQGEAVIVSIPHGTPMLEANQPDLPKLSKSIIIPDDAAMEIRIVSSQFIEIQNILVAPSKGNLMRNINPDDIPFVFGDIYSKNEYFPTSVATLQNPYIFRDYRGQTITLNPVQYNPVTKTLRIYTEVVVQVFESGKSEINVFNRKNEINVIDAEFNALYNHHFINYQVYANRYTPVSEEGKMLIITYGAFAPAMQPFIEWKRMKGMQVEMVNVSAIGTTNTAIKNYVSNYYNTQGLTFLLLVGDGEQIPSLYKSGDSDAAYGHIIGTDSYAEVIVGRFSAENLSQVETQVARVINYEKTPETTIDYYSKFVGIGSSQGTGDDNEYDYEHMHNIIVKLSNFTYTGGNEMYDGSQGNLDLPGDPTATMLATALNEGRGIINYVGHGSDFSFVTTGFSVSNVTALTNENKLPFIFSVACVNGNFHGQTCLAEAFLRATHNSNPTGAIAMFASTINQSWSPPMEGQDEINDILVGTYPNNLKFTFGGLAINGCMKMNDSYPDGSGAEMTDTWTIFGDPSVVVRTAMPTPLNVTYTPAFFIGMNQFTIESETEGALVTLSSNGQILASGKIIGGTLTLTIEPFTNVATMNVTVTAFNKTPYLGSIEVLPNNSAWITLNSYSLNDQNENGMADPGESFGFDGILNNVGSQPANGLVATLTSQSNYVTIENESHTFGVINADTTADFTNIFGIKVADSIPDQYMAEFIMNLSDALDSTWNVTLKVVLNAPVISLGNLNVLDDLGGNNNSHMNPGEVVRLNINIQNTGHATGIAGQAVLTSNNPLVTILDSSVNIDPIGAGQSLPASYTVLVNPQIADGTVINFHFTCTFGSFLLEQDFTREIGTAMEDFESNNFNSYPWIVSTSNFWTITNRYPFDGDYCAKSAQIGDNSKSEMIITLNILENDSISFYRKVSSQYHGSVFDDKLEFWLDNSRKGVWGGEMDWARVAYPVSAGTHTFTWRYKKNSTTAMGQDCAWIDNIQFPGFENNSGDTTQYIQFLDNPPATVHAQQNFSYEVLLDLTDETSTDTVFTVSLYQAPGWMNISQNAKGHYVISGIPAVGDEGTYQVIIIATNGELFAYQSFTLLVKWPVSVNELSENMFKISVNPNPVMSKAILKYNLTSNSQISLNIFDMLGNKVAVLMNKEQKLKGLHTLPFDASVLNPGIYFVKLETGNKVFTTKMIVK